MKGYAKILVISDTHFPYQHKDTVAFLSALKQKYKFDCIVHIGDEVDQHALNFHDGGDPDLDSPGKELTAAIEALQPLYKLFPRVHVLESNHGSLPYRRAKVARLPKQVLKSYREIICAPKGWEWNFDLTLPLSNGQSCYFHHARSASALKASQQMGTNVVFGHHHNSFYIHHWFAGTTRHWGMIGGCLVDYNSLAMAYGKNNLKIPILGCSGILKGEPKLFPMQLTKAGRWNGFVP